MGRRSSNRHPAEVDLHLAHHAKNLSDAASQLKVYNSKLLGGGSNDTSLEP